MLIFTVIVMFYLRKSCLLQFLKALARKFATPFVILIVYLTFKGFLWLKKKILALTPANKKRYER